MISSGSSRAGGGRGRFVRSAPLRASAERREDGVGFGCWRIGEPTHQPDVVLPDPIPPRILVVDDNPDNLELLVAVLEAQAYRVETVTSGQEATTVSATAR